MAKLLRYALQNDTFREIFCCRSYTTVATAAHPEGSHNTPAYHVLDAKAVYEQIGMSE